MQRNHGRYGAAVSSLLAPLSDTVVRLLERVDSIPADRRIPLDQLADFIRSQIAEDATVKLLFICTHNSRRSHMGQAWGAAAGAYFGLSVQSFSGGTEATAFNPSAVEALRSLGFEVDSPPGANPRYQVRFSAEIDPTVCFSKVFNASENPSSGFVAIMTCSDADEACPAVPGAALRIATPYDDPKASDGTPDQGKAYAERAQQIGTELLYAFQQATQARTP